MKLLRHAALAVGFCAAAAAAHAACPPDVLRIDEWQLLRSDKWALPDPAAAEPLAKALLPCLADPDPRWRDELAFEALSAWMRGGQLGPSAVRGIGAQLLPWLAADAPDPQGFAKPFAALALSEVARADRLKPLFSPTERDDLVNAAAYYLAGVHDYRGFDAGEGWRHGVAHGADLALQLAMNPAVTRVQVDRLLDAVATQVLPEGTHFYHYGEGERLARPVLLAARRGLHNKEFWDTWLGRIGTAAMMADGEPPTQAALARLHNARAFLWPLYGALQQGDDAALKQRMLPGVLAALRQLQ